MKNDLDLHALLRVFEKVRSHGENKEGNYQLEGINAMSDHDGYTVVMSDVECSLTLFFHNKYEFDYPSERAREAFEKRIQFIDANF